MSPLKNAVNKAKETVASGIIGLLLGYLSDAILLLERQPRSELSDSIFDTIVYGILRFEPMLRDLAKQSDSGIDDKIVDEIIEACLAIKHAGGIELLET
ncbi:MAG: hypothetical protein GF317_04590 [Candidatus Lokiarchaeota archaeon]|nr:hypothetical protein [Candidatus Lokiarchaeota archaeon]